MSLSRLNGDCILHVSSFLSDRDALWLRRTCRMAGHTMRFAMEKRHIQFILSAITRGLHYFCDCKLQVERSVTIRGVETKVRLYTMKAQIDEMIEDLRAEVHRVIQTHKYVYNTKTKPRVQFDYWRGQWSISVHE